MDNTIDTKNNLTYKAATSTTLNLLYIAKPFTRNSTLAVATLIYSYLSIIANIIAIIGNIIL